eukprot:RCo023786
MPSGKCPCRLSSWPTPRLPFGGSVLCAVAPLCTTALLRFKKPLAAVLEQPALLLPPDLFEPPARLARDGLDPVPPPLPRVPACHRRTRCKPLPRAPALLEEPQWSEALAGAEEYGSPMGHPTIYTTPGGTLVKHFNDPLYVDMYKAVAKALEPAVPVREVPCCFHGVPAVLSRSGSSYLCGLADPEQGRSQSSPNVCGFSLSKKKWYGPPTCLKSWDTPWCQAALAEPVDSDYLWGITQRSK